LINVAAALEGSGARCARTRCDHGAHEARQILRSVNWLT
jgi:hypothetical protein